MGLLPYLYLVFAAYEPKKGTWGDTSDVYGVLGKVVR